MTVQSSSFSNDQTGHTDQHNVAEMIVTELGAGVMKRATRLADQRELIYFDDPNTSLAETRRVDTRTLQPRPETATMRFDVLTGNWISVATSRQERIMLPPKQSDPLAPQSQQNPSEIPSLYDVAVFENRSPAFGPALGPALDPAGEGSPLERTRPAYGRCEVICFSPESEGSFASLTPTRARTVIEALCDRVATISALAGIEQVFPFENRGAAIGVTLTHPHGQIYGYPFVTPRTQNVLRSIEEHGPDLFARILDREQASSRVIVSGTYWTAFVPFAARWPLEVHLLPHRHIADLAQTTEDERAELAPLSQQLLGSLDRLYGSPTPYIAAWHQAPTSVGRQSVRLSLEITSPRRSADKLKYLAASEASMGAWIADIAPETAAEQLRNAFELTPAPGEF